MLAVPECSLRLHAALTAAEPLLRGINETASAQPLTRGKWSSRQVIGHLIDSASNNHQRFVRGALQDELVFPPYEQEKWVELQRYQEMPWSALLTLWVALNRHLADLMAAIPKDVRLRVRTTHNFDQIATYAPPSPDKATLDYFMNDYVDHLERHMRQILGAEWSA